MTKSEISELKKRFSLNKSNITNIYGCYVNSNKEVISYLDESLSLMPQEEADQYLSILKKVLATSSRNMTDIIFTTAQVQDSDEHRLLMDLREGKEAARQELYKTVIASLDMADSNYLILCANDAYDVPYRKHNDIDRSARDYDADHADQVYRWFVCAVCPVKDGKLALGYFSGENEFHNSIAKQIVGAPELGFLFPAFDDRKTNIYSAVMYSRKPEEMHHEFIEAVFKTEIDMTVAEEREAFESVLLDSVDCNFDVFRAVNEGLKAKVDEADDEEPIMISCSDIVRILADSGVAEEQQEAFKAGFKDRFDDRVLDPQNIIDMKRFEVKAGEVTVSVSADQSFVIETREIDGRKYILIPADAGAEVNGVAVKV